MNFSRAKDLLEDPSFLAAVCKFSKWSCKVVNNGALILNIFRALLFFLERGHIFKEHTPRSMEQGLDGDESPEEFLDQ